MDSNQNYGIKLLNTNYKKIKIFNGEKAKFCL